MKKIIILGFLILSLIVITNKTFASTTNGTINETYKYAWGENVGFVDFKNITITDTNLSGSAYGENIGWIDLSTITNDSEGNLSGYAWGENIGWVDFSKAKIGTDGIWTGGAYGENIGWIIFGIGSNKVETDWRPQSTRPVARRTSSGSSSVAIQNFLKQNTTTPIIQQEKVERTLRLGMIGEDVKDLQKYLNTHGYMIAKTGAGSPNNETMKFGKLTQKAIIKFQIANKLKGDGIVGPLTKALLK